MMDSWRTSQTDEGGTEMFEALDSIGVTGERRCRPFRDPDGTMLCIVAHA